MPYRVLFVCVENAGRSQMAEGFTRALGGGRLRAWSAGSKPSGKLNPLAVAAMRERDVDISNHRSKSLAEVPSEGWDYVVTMGCGDACPFVPSKARLDWEFPDPKGASFEEVRGIRDRVESKVRALLAELDISPAGS